MTAEAPKGQGPQRRTLWIIVIAVCVLILFILLIIAIALVCTHLAKKPGAFFKVHPDADIKYNKVDDASFAAHLETLTNLLAKYADPKQENCSSAQLWDNRAIDNGCGIKASAFEDCTADKGFGYKDGKPCVFLTLEDMPDNWKPEQYNKHGVPDSIKNLYADEHHVVACSLKTDKKTFDAGNDEIKISPKGGFPAFFFPLREKNNLAPIVAVQLRSPLRPGEDYTFECKLWHPKMEEQGSYTVQFKLHHAHSAASGLILSMNLYLLLLVLGKLVY